MDRLGDLYLVTEKEIRKYDTDGKFMNAYTYGDSIEVTLLEPWNPLRVFVYNRTKQTIILLDRFMQPMGNLALDPSLAIEPWLAGPIPNNHFWLLDKADYSLKKVDPDGKQVKQDINLTLTAGAKPNFTFLREYQNLMFLIDQKSGVYIYSILGQPIRTFPIVNLPYLGFLGEEIYYLDNGKIKFFDLYSEEQHELAVDSQAKFVLLTDERLIVVKPSGVEVWGYKPN